MECPYLKSLEDAGRFSHNTYICKETGKEIEYGSRQYENLCSCSDHDECPIYKSAR